MVITIGNLKGIYLDRTNCELVEEKSDGRLMIDIFYSYELAGQVESLDALAKNRELGRENPELTEEFESNCANFKKPTEGIKRELCDPLFLDYSLIVSQYNKL